MKKYFKYLSFCFLAGVGLSSCEPDDNGYKEDPVDVGGFAYLEDRSITVLDQNETVSINLMTEGDVQFESVVIEDEDGDEIATATISGETATFNTSTLGEFLFEDEDEELTELTGAFPLTIVSTLSNGTVVRDPAAIAVTQAISVSGPEEVQFMDGTEDEEVILEYSVDTHGAPVDDFELEYRIGSEGTYQTDEINPIEGTEGEIDFSDFDYDAYGLEEGDTLYYRFTATSGELTDVVETSVAVIPQAFTDGASGTVSSDAALSELDLMTGDNFAAGTESGDVVFSGDVNSPGFTAIESASDIEFAETDEEIDGVLDARNAFENSSATTTISDVETGDTIVYKVTREIENEDEEMVEVVHYGYIEIESVTVVDGETVSFEVNASEGQLAPAPEPGGGAAE